MKLSQSSDQWWYAVKMSGSKKCGQSEWIHISWYSEGMRCVEILQACRKRLDSVSYRRKVQCIWKEKKNIQITIVHTRSHHSYIYTVSQNTNKGTNKRIEEEKMRKKAFTGSDINTVKTHIWHSAIQANTSFVTITCTFFISWRDSPLVGVGLLIHEVCFSRSHTTTHHSR
jgi:hypothetical protein